jgi:hypothetical protein
MSFVFELERRIIRATRALAIVGFVVLLVASLTTMLDVALRWVANAPIKGLSDFEALAVAIVIASCLPLVVAQRQNISIRFLGDALGPAASRWLDAFRRAGAARVRHADCVAARAVYRGHGGVRANDVAPAHLGDSILVGRDAAGGALRAGASDCFRRGRSACDHRSPAAREEVAEDADGASAA